MRAALLGGSVALVLQGCAMSGAIRNDAAAYEAAIDDLTDRFLVENILQARDKAPLHFVDIPLIHEALQTGASLSATAPFGAHNGSTTRASVAAQASIQVSPSFDVAQLNSKDFVTGIASPIDARFLKYWLDRGLDSRIVLLLFVSSLEINDTATHKSVFVKNSPRESIEQVLADERSAKQGVGHDPCGSSDFSRYLAVINVLKPTLTASLYRERTQIGEDFALDTKVQFKDISGLDYSKFAIERAPNNLHRLYALGQTPNVALCFGPSNARDAIRFAGPRSPEKATCTSAWVTHNTTDPSAYVGGGDVPMRRDDDSPGYCSILSQFLSGAHANLKLTFEVRSVGEMIQFLGDLVKYQESLEEARTTEFGGTLARHNSPVTLDYCRPPATCPTPAGALFNVQRSPSDSRLEVKYRGDSFWIANASSSDHSLEVLSVVHQLIDLNKSATDIRPTPIVQVVP